MKYSVEVPTEWEEDSTGFAEQVDSEATFPNEVEGPNPDDEVAVIEVSYEGSEEE